MDNIIQILDENKGELSILEYFEQCKENDPRFYNWCLSDSENIGDFGMNMTLEQVEEFSELERKITSLDEVRKEFEID